MLNKLLNSIIFNHKTDYLRLILLFNLILLFTISSFSICFPATALLRQHHETPGVLRYHAQDSLKDGDRNTWQVILFPDNLQTSKTRYYLRLVGFPGIKSFNHPQSLEIITSQGNILTAADAYPKSAPAPNVGQYDFTPIMAKLPTKGSLKLAVILKGNSELSLKIPHEVLTEWQLLAKEIEDR